MLSISSLQHAYGLRLSPKSWNTRPCDSGIALAIPLAGVLSSTVQSLKITFLSDVQNRSPADELLNIADGLSTPRQDQHATETLNYGTDRRRCKPARTTSASDIDLASSRGRQSSAKQLPRRKGAKPSPENLQSLQQVRFGNWGSLLNAKSWHFQRLSRKQAPSVQRKSVSGAVEYVSGP